MIILQASMIFGTLFLILFGVFLLIGIPLLTRFLMKTIWRILGKEDFLKNKTPYYKDPFLYFSILISSIIVLSLIYYKLIMRLDINFD